MKLTCDQGSDDWRLHFRRPLVLLDGSEVDYVVELDTDEGYVDHLVKDADGHFVRDGDTAKIERLHGVVEVSEAG